MDREVVPSHDDEGEPETAVRVASVDELLLRVQLRDMDGEVVLVVDWDSVHVLVLLSVRVADAIPEGVATEGVTVCERAAVAVQGVPVPRVSLKAFDVDSDELTVEDEEVERLLRSLEAVETFLLAVSVMESEKLPVPVSLG